MLNILVSNFFLWNSKHRSSFYTFISIGLNVRWCHCLIAIRYRNWPKRSTVFTNCFRVVWHFESNLQYWKNSFMASYLRFWNMCSSRLNVTFATSSLLWCRL